MNSKKWRNGYSVGFQDGYEKAKRDFTDTKVIYDEFQEFVDTNWSSWVCSIPTQQVDNEIPDGLSYEEIYGSVVYQQNKKRENK